MQIKLLKGDITKVKADAIINAANTSLLGGGGVDGAIHRAGGQAILHDCMLIRNRQGGCAVGDAVITTAGKLDATHVIHTVGPRWNEGKSSEVEKLASCYTNVLELAEEHELNVIAIPNISTGIYRFPKYKAADIAINTVKNAKARFLQEVIFVCYDDENYRIYQELLAE